MRHHAVDGMRSTFVFAEGYSTKTEILLKAGSQAWEVGGYLREATERKNKVTPSMPGNFHATWKAGYEFYKWKVCQHNPATQDGYSCDRQIDPHGWTWGMYKKETDCCNDAPYYNNDEWGIRLKYPTVKKDGARQVFGGGFSLKAGGVHFGLNSSVAWKANTSMSWEPKGDTNPKKCLYGKGAYPPDAAVVYAFWDCNPDR